MPRSVLVYRNDLLAVSEPFIRVQGDSLRRFQAVYVGRRHLPASSLPAERCVLLRPEKTPNLLCKATGFSTDASSEDLDRLHELNPVLLHAHFGPDGVSALPIAQNLNIPLIVTFHGYDINVSSFHLLRMDRRLLAYILRRPRLLKSASMFVAVSEFIQRQLVRRGFPREKIIVHYIGVDTQFFSPSPVIKRENIVLFVGRLVENKGCEYLLRAMRIVQQYDPHAQTIVIGDGELRNPLERLARKLGLANYRFLGSLSQAEICHWMNRARIFCVPSIRVASGASEAFGIVFAEAQSMGLPVVSFATGGIPEAVDDGRTGLLARPMDLEGLTRSLLLLLQGQHAWQRFSPLARQRACERFDIQKQTSILERIYETVLENPYRPYEPVSIPNTTSRKRNIFHEQ